MASRLFKPLRQESPSSTASAIIRAFERTPSSIRQCSECLDALDRSGRLGNVYFIRAVDTDRVKIGYAMNVASRMSELATASPFALELVLSYRGYISCEHTAHYQFRAQRIFPNREWFFIRDDLKAFIDGWLSLGESE